MLGLFKAQTSFDLEHRYENIMEELAKLKTDAKGVQAANAEVIAAALAEQRSIATLLEKIG